jgi:hypothetical protein
MKISSLIKVADYELDDQDSIPGTRGALVFATTLIPAMGLDPTQPTI